MTPPIIALDDAQMQKLALYMRYEKQLDRILESGMLDMRQSTMAVYVDGNGQVASIKVIDHQLYPRKVDALSKSPAILRA